MYRKKLFELLEFEGLDSAENDSSTSPISNHLDKKMSFAVRCSKIMDRFGEHEVDLDQNDESSNDSHLDSDGEYFSSKKTGVPSPESQQWCRRMQRAEPSRSLSFQNILECQNQQKRSFSPRKTTSSLKIENIAYDTSKAYTVTYDQYGIREECNSLNVIITQEMDDAMKVLHGI